MMRAMMDRRDQNLSQWAEVPPEVCVNQRNVEEQYRPDGEDHLGRESGGEEHDTDQRVVDHIVERVHARCGEGVLVSPSSFPYESMQPEHVVPMHFDGSYEGDGWNAAAGFYGAWNQARAMGSDDDVSDFGVFVQAGVFVAVEPSTCTKNSGAGMSRNSKRPLASVTAFAAEKASTRIVAPTMGNSVKESRTNLLSTQSTIQRVG